MESYRFSESGVAWIREQRARHDVSAMNAWMAVVVAPKKRGAHAASSGRRPWRLTYHAEILLISLAALLIEISYTRIISYKLFYYYVYLIIGLALLGVGAGGVLVAVSRRLRDAATDTILFWSFFVGAVATVVAYLIIAFIRINTLAVWLYGTSASVKSLVMLLVLCLCVFVSLRSCGHHLRHALQPPAEGDRRPVLRRPPRCGHRMRGGDLRHQLHRSTGHSDGCRGGDGGRRPVVGPADGPGSDRSGRRCPGRGSGAEHRAGAPTVSAPRHE